MGRRPGECLHQRSIGSAGFDGAALQDEHAAALRLALRLDQQTGFSHPRLAGEQHSVALTAPSGLDRARQYRKLGASSNQRQVRAHCCILIQIVYEPQRIEAERSQRKPVLEIR